MQTPAIRLRPMGIIDQLDMAFRLYRNNLLVLLGIAVVLQVPLIAFGLLNQAFIAGPAEERYMAASLGYSSDTGTAALAYCGALILYFALHWSARIFLAPFFFGALGYAVSELYLGRRVDVLAAYRYLLSPRRFGGLLLVAVLWTIAAIFLAAIPCIGWFSGVFLGLRVMLAPPAIALENRGPINAFERSWGLMENHVLRGLALVIAGFVIQYLLSYAVGLLLSLLLNAVQGALGLPDAAITLGASALGGLIDLFWAPVAWGMLTIFYYDLRMRKEGFDLQLQADQVALETATA